MDALLGLSGLLALAVGLIWLPINLIRKKSKVTPIIIMSIGLLFFIIGINMSPQESNDLQAKAEFEQREILGTETDENVNLENEEKDLNPDEATIAKEVKIATKPVELSEEEFKAACLEYDYVEMTINETRHLNDYVKRDVMVAGIGTVGDSNEVVYFCKENTGGGGYMSPPIYVYDKRKDKTQAIKLYDKLYVYGEITELNEYMTWDTAGMEVYLDAKYIDFNGKFGE
jgi:hypothetical protein